MSSETNPKQILAWIGVLLVLGFSFWFGSKALREAKPASGDGLPGGRPPSTVIVKPVEEKEMVKTLKVTGSLRASQRAEVAAREAAAIDSVAVDEGDLVKSGDVLATLDGRRLLAQLAEAEAALTAAKAELTQRVAENERADKDAKMMAGLWEQQAIAERVFLDSVSAAKVANSRVDAANESISAAQKRLELLKVRRTDLEVSAPFDGRVVARHAEIGEWVTAGDPVVTLVSTGEIEAWLQLPERFTTEIKNETPESVELSLPGQAEPLRAEKFSVIGDVEGRSRRFNLIARIPDPENLLTPGTSVEAVVPIGKPELSLVVSSDAVLKSYAGSYVYVAAPQESFPPIATRIPVDVMFDRDGEAVLAPGGLKVGDSVIVEGNERLFPNTPLDPHPFAEARAGQSGGEPPGP